MFMTLEALSDAGVRHGLPRQLALNLAAQTMLVSRVNSFVFFLKYGQEDG